MKYVFIKGIKTRIGVIGLDGRASDCPSSRNSEVESILKWAHFAGKSTGIVTTTRVNNFPNYSDSFETFPSLFRHPFRLKPCNAVAERHERFWTV